MSFLIAGLAPIGVQAADLLVRSGQTLTGPFPALNSNEHAFIEKGATLKQNGGFNLIEASGFGQTIINHGQAILSSGSHLVYSYPSNQISLLNTGYMYSNNGVNDTMINLNGDDHYIQNDGHMIAGVGVGSTVFINGNRGRIINNGQIQATEFNAAGINLSSNDGIVINRGQIMTFGYLGNGIISFDNNSQIYHSGIISTYGQDAYGINITGTGSYVLSTGAITTSGDQSPAIGLEGTALTADISGILRTKGADAHGLYSGSSNLNSKINLQADILVTGANSHAIHLNGQNDHLTLNNRITATEQATTALFARNNSEITFQSQSQVIGQIDVDATSQISVESYQAAPSTNLTIPNHGSLNIEGSHPILKQGNQVHRADSSGFVAQRLALAATSQTVHNHITTRLNRTPRLRPIQVASTQITPDLLTPSPQSAVWGGFIGGYQQMDQSRDHLAYQKTSYGLITGYDMPVEDHRLGFNLAFINDSMQTNDRSIESDSKNLSTGVYGSFSLGTWQIAPALMLGYQFQENRRTIIDNLNGIETATSAQHNFSLSPALTVSRPLTLDQDGRYQLRPLAQIAYHYGYFGGYTETGTSSSNLKIEGSSNLKIEGSSAHALKTRLQLSLDHQFGTYLQGGFSVRSGLDHHYRSADKINLSLGTARTRFDPTGKTSQMSGFVGFNLYYDVIDGLTVAGDVEVNRANNSGTHYQAALTAKWVF